ASTPPRSVVHLLRDLTPQVLGALTRRHREERIAGELVIEEMLAQPAESDFDPDQDDTLALLFMCCHPSLTTPSAIALTLRAVGGLTTGEIAKAFFVPEVTMAQRISRAKQTIKNSNIPFSLASGEERDERLDAVMHILYLIFNEGYTSSGGERLQRVDLSTEAIRLTRALKEVVTDSGEIVGLLALMLLTEARSAARSGPAGELIPLDEQDRTRWDQSLIQEGGALSSKAMSSPLIGPYQLQAAIAAIHDRAETAEQTDWAQIQSLYGMLLRISDNPMVALNHAVATAMVEGVEAGLSLVDTIARDERLKGHYRVDAVRAHLYDRAGKHHLALEHYRRAADGTSSLPERNYLLGKAARIGS
ncbi:MAG TPA: DUF6596 domain-containing protein, partial [Steroidobacteraceae bacterium]